MADEECGPRWCSNGERLRPAFSIENAVVTMSASFEAGRAAREQSEGQEALVNLSHFSSSEDKHLPPVHTA